MNMATGYSVFVYRYRDASNRKVWGKVLLSGTVSDDDTSVLRRRLAYMDSEKEHC